MAEIDCSRVTRLEVINHSGAASKVSYDDERPRSVAAYGVDVELSLQDDGRTLKVFLRDRGGRLSEMQGPDEPIADDCEGSDRPLRTLRAIGQLHAGTPQVPAHQLVDDLGPVGVLSCRCCLQVGPVLIGDADGSMLGLGRVRHAANPVRCTYVFQRTSLRCTYT